MDLLWNYYMMQVNNIHYAIKHNKKREESKIIYGHVSTLKSAHIFITQLWVDF